MKLIVTIPAYNEQDSLAQVIKSIPRQIPGIKQVKVLVWDDGSDDNTSATAKKSGADYVFRNKRNLGLAKTFHLMLTKSLELEADLIVNTDADNQYDQAQIPALIKPILDLTADMVIGDRQVDTLNHMPPAKQFWNKVGSWTISWLTGSQVNDASSGFRAFSRACAQSFNLLSTHTYTHETIIQAVNHDLVIEEVPVTFKARLHGESRLIDGVWPHLKKSASTIVRTILMYKAFKYLLIIGLLTIFAGMLGGLRFLSFWLQGQGAGHIQSLILSAILIQVGFTTCVMGVLADLISINRRTIEKNK